MSDRPSLEFRFSLSYESHAVISISRPETIDDEDAATFASFLDMAKRSLTKVAAQNEQQKMAEGGKSRTARLSVDAHTCDTDAGDSRPASHPTT